MNNRHLSHHRLLLDPLPREIRQRLAELVQACQQLVQLLRGLGLVLDTVIPARARHIRDLETDQGTSITTTLPLSVNNVTPVYL